MKGMTIRRAAEICAGRLTREDQAERELRHVVIDSRAVEPGDLFVAYRGERTDGHDYMDSAFRHGAACCLAQRLPEGVDGPCILVENVQQALEAIATAYRTELTMPIIGITGSVGKTSAKEMIASVLSRRFRVLKTEGNLNNQIGVPMTLSRIGSEHQAAVVEMGISGFGEMRELARMARPDLAVFTVIGHAHLEFLHDLEGVLRAKTEMLEFMPEDAPVIVNGDDPLLMALDCRQNKISVGLGEGCLIRAEELRIDEEGRTACSIVYQQRRVPARISAFGRHMVYAALEGAAVGFLMGLSDEEIAAGISDFAPVGRRSAVTRAGGLTLIDDCYNANPDSVKSGVDSVAALPGRHLCILGDMLELGEEGPALHRESGRYAREHGMDAVWTCGELGAEIAAGAGEVGRHFESADALIAALPELLAQGGTLLVKASRGMRFERISEAVKTLMNGEDTE